MASHVIFFTILILAASATSHILKSQPLQIPPEGLTLEINIKPELNQPAGSRGPGRMSLDFSLNAPPPPPPSPMNAPPIRNPDFVPDIEDRFGIRVGKCPTGYTQTGGFCFPNGRY